MVILILIKELEGTTHGGNHTIMANANEPIVVKVMMTTVYNNDGKTSVSLRLNKKLKKFQENKTLNTFTEVEDNVLSLNYGDVMRLVENNETAAFYLSVVEDRFSQRVLGTLLFGAKIVVEQELKTKGEMIEGRTEPLSRDMWFNTVSRYEPSEMAIKLMEKEIGL